MSKGTLCLHPHVRCLNEYELIRKYRCDACAAVMMCQCDEEIGRELLPHQLQHGTDLDSRQRVPVTLGFVRGTCRECRGLAPEAHPLAAIHGRTTKIKRYYWRELRRREWEIFRAWARANGVAPSNARTPEPKAARAQAAEQALREIKELHARSPKYSFQEESPSAVLDRCKVPVEHLWATYRVAPTERKAHLQDGSEWLGIEEFARRHYVRSGWSVLFLESRPLHVLFGVYMWLVIQDPADEHVRIVGFGDRHGFDEKRPGHVVWTHLPDDFGTKAYGRRRADAITKHLSEGMQDRKNLLWLFDYWTPHSESLRNYLWAHRTEDVQSARRLVEILSPACICNILRYLVADYWGRYLGWPDLLVHGGSEFFFAEVKSSRDKLSEDQKRWIVDNYETLQIPFRLLKVHKRGVSG